MEMKFEITAIDIEWLEYQIEPDLSESLTSAGLLLKLANAVREIQRKELEE